jgi:plasmid stabilization system protein ParE
LDIITKPVFWTTRAVKDLEKATRFNAVLYGFDKAKQIALELQKGTEILENSNYDFSKIGSTDYEFVHLRRNYRKLIHSHFKITYREGKTKIYINRIFDTRQNPSKNK